MTRDTLAKIKVLSGFLGTSSNEANALRCIQSEVRNNVSVQDWLRESGVLSRIMRCVGTDNLETRDLACYALSSCVGGNYDSKLQASSLSLFDSLNANLTGSETASVSQFVSLMLIDSLCEGFPCAQELMYSTGCIHVLLAVLSGTLKRFMENIDHCSQRFSLFLQLIVKCLGSTLASPSHYENQQALVTHNLFAQQLLPLLSSLSIKHGALIEQLSAVVSSAYRGNDKIFTHKEESLLLICQKLDEYSKLKSPSAPAVGSLVKTMYFLISEQGEFSASFRERLSLMCLTLARLADRVSDKELQQQILFCMVTLVDRNDFDQQVLAGSGIVKSLYKLTRGTEDAVIHCSVSYILLGLDSLTEKEMNFVRKLAPGSLVRMGLCIDMAKIIAPNERIVTKTRKKLFEADDMMELLSSDEETELNDSGYASSSGKKTTPTKLPMDKHKWLQLTPPSKPRILSISPGWQIRVKRLKNLLIQRKKQKLKKDKQMPHTSGDVGDEKVSSQRRRKDTLKKAACVRRPLSVIQ